MSILALRNNEQVALWKFELSGQLSDGHWENSRPHDHWRPWCDAQIICDPANLGRDFWAQKENYNFTSGDLLEVVDLRMIGAVRLVKALGWEIVEKHLRWGVNCDGTLCTYGRVDIPADIITKAKAALADTNSYTRKELMRDLRDMKNIIKMRRK